MDDLACDFNQLLLRLLSPNVYYQSDVYTDRGAGYDPIVVWQFWGRAAEAS
jgi:hypothetical protein